MMDETKVLGILDLLSDKAREFVQVSKEILEGEGALQARDGIDPTEWQVCSTLSAFINYIGETERLRYGHFAFDLDPKNNGHRRSQARCVLGRMKMFWENDDTDDLTGEDMIARNGLVDRFLRNDAEIKKHVKQQPDLYDPNLDQEAHRDWSIRLRILGETEAHLMREWDELVRAQRERCNAVPAAQQP